MDEKKEPKKPDEFQRFDSFLRKLVAVPKAEIDKLEVEYLKRKAARKKKKGR